MTDEQLEALLTDLESDVVERKESLGGDAKETIRQAICAFAYDLPDHRKPGVIDSCRSSSVGWIALFSLVVHQSVAAIVVCELDRSGISLPVFRAVERCIASGATGIPVRHRASADRTFPIALVVRRVRLADRYRMRVRDCSRPGDLG